MKAKRLVSGLLAACMTVCLMAVPAYAAYKDTLPEWAKPYIEDVTKRGLFGGYTNNTFRPYNNVTAAEALVLAGRIAVPKSETRTDLLTKHESVISAILGTGYTWARAELAACLETGVLTQNELHTLSQSGSLGNSMKKEDLSVYLVRAMGVTEHAKSLGVYTLSFNDSGQITNGPRPSAFVPNQ